MAPRGKDADLQTQEVLQAVVLADSFAHHFRPISIHMPKVLIPLAATPMLEYTLEFLAAGGVQEIFVFCCAHAEIIERYVEETELRRRLGTVTLHILVARAPCFSAGDALREVEAAGVIKSDFVLVPGDVVANLQLAPLLAAHKARREADREAVLTTVMKRIPPGHRSRRAGEEMLVALSGETGRLLLYEDASMRRADGKLRLPSTLLQETDKLQLHTDLYDTHIDICTLEMLVLLQDNFDWQDLRKDLLPGVLGQFEMLGKTIYTQVVENEYAARVHDPYTYDKVSRDVMARWAFPLTPDANMLPGSSYRHSRGGVYMEHGVTVARSSEVDGGVLGSGTSVGDGALLRESVLGRKCLVAPRARVVASYLWDGVKVGEGAQLQGCICCDGVVIGAKAVVPHGVILGPGVVVSADAVLAPFSRYTSLSAEEVEALGEDDEDEDDAADDDDDDHAETAQVATGDAPKADVVMVPHADVHHSSMLGADGVGSLWKVVNSARSIGFVRAAAHEAEEEPSEVDDDEELVAAEEDEADAAEEFYDEVSMTVQRAVASGHTVENVTLEVNSLKFAQNRSFSDCVDAILPTLLEGLSLEGRAKKERMAEVKRCLSRWGGLLARFIQSDADQDALLKALQTSAEGNDALAEIFEGVMHAIYDSKWNLLDEDAILRWNTAAAKAPEGSEVKRLQAQAQRFVQWLQEASEDDDDGEDDD